MNNEKAESGKSHISPTGEFQLELGDIIQMNAPTNTEIHEHTYYLFYADSAILKMIDLSTQQLMQLSIDQYVEDESIINIDLLSRSEVKGFANQNRLLPTTWIDIHFSGDFPYILSGEITNLEEDMIEVTTYPSLKIIYLDFAYKGISDEMMIKKIEIRDRPSVLKKSLAELTAPDAAEGVEGEDVATMEYDNTGEFVIQIPENATPNPLVRDVINDKIDTAIQIEDESEDLGEVVVLMEVPESQRRYSIEAQLNDLMEELISKIPLEKRQGKVMEKIHTIVTRFKELHSDISIFDATGNVKNMKIVDKMTKPFVDKFSKTRSGWILPVIQDVRRKWIEGDELNKNLSEMEKVINQFADKKPAIDYLGMLTEVDRLMKFYSDLPFPLNQTLISRDMNVEYDTEAIWDKGDFTWEEGMRSHDADKVAMPVKYVVQKLITGDTTMKKADLGGNRQKIFERKMATMSDRLPLKSVLIMPSVFAIQDQVRYNKASIYRRTLLANKPISLSRVLKQKTEVNIHKLRDLTKEFDFETKTFDPNNESSLGERFLQHIVSLQLAANLGTGVADADTMRQYMNAIIPQTRTIVKSVINMYAEEGRQVFNMNEFFKYLEPFQIEPNNLNFKSYLEIRYYIKELIKTYKRDLVNKSKQFKSVELLKGLNPVVPNRVADIYREHLVIPNLFHKIYNTNEQMTKYSSELMNHVLSSDNGAFYSALLNFMMVMLYAPEDLTQFHMEPARLENITDMEKIKANGCDKLFIAKKYKSLAELQKDNNVDDIYYDRDYDDTPYDIMSNYKSEKKRLEPAKFFEFLTQSLVDKHDCPPALSEELAQTLIRGQKMVKEGEYAILETRPMIPSDVDKSKLSKEEVREMEKEAELRKQVEYYKRIKNNWVRDNDVDSESFIDSNTLFCNLASSCSKVSNSGTCLPNVSASVQMKLATRSKMMAEFDKRLSRSLDDLKKEVEKNTNQGRRLAQRRFRFKEIQDKKSSILAFEIGKYAKSTEHVVVSPYMPLRNELLAQSDFSKKQMDIIRFVETCCREPMVKELAEEKHWYYCLETNTKLFPLSLYLLALAFKQGNYQETLDRICREHGTLSDDGDAIVDKYANGEFVLRAIDFSTDEGFTDEGFKITTNAIMESDLASMVLETLSKKDKVFEDADAQMIYNVFKTMSNHIGIAKDAVENSVEEFCVRTTLEMIRDPSIVTDETTYSTMMAESKKDKPMMSYATYKGQTMITMVACTLLVAIQTLIPSFKTHKTFPRCVRSFDGFPMTGIEDIAGIKYLSCVLFESKGSDAPWDSISKLSANVLAKRMTTILRDYIVERNDVQTLYKMKRDYLLLHPEENIPEDHALTKWVHFMPPVVPFSIDKVLGVSTEFEKELFDSIKQAKAGQRELMFIMNSKVHQHAYAIVGSILSIVNKKQLLLATSGGRPFLENACCNEPGSKLVPLEYFNAIDGNIETYIKKVNKIEELQRKVRNLTAAPMLFHNESTRIVKTDHNMVVEDIANVYGAYIHYCNFNNDIPIPFDLEIVCNEKPMYNRHGSIKEKIEFMRGHGKVYDRSHLFQLMQIVNRNNRVVLGDLNKNVSPVDMFKDMLESLQIRQSTIVEQNLVKLVQAALADYDPKKLVSEERDSLRKLNIYLTKTNEKMHGMIVKTIFNNTRISEPEQIRINQFMTDYERWNIDENESTLFSVLGQMRNSVYRMTKVLPNIIVSRLPFANIPKHWGFAEQHNINISMIINSYYKHLNQFMDTDEQKTSLCALLDTITQHTRDLVLFMDTIPTSASLEKGDKVFMGLFNKRTLFGLYKYVWYSVFFEYITLSRSPEFTKMDKREKRAIQREKIDQLNQTADNLEAVVQDDREDVSEYRDQLLEAQIQVGSEKELLKRVCLLLQTYLQMDMRHKKMVDQSYSILTKKTQLDKDKDKQRITDYLGNMQHEERQIEQRKRKYGLGMWNVGKEIYKYDKKTYLKEVDIAHEFKMGDLTIEGDLPQLGENIIPDIVIDVHGLETYEEMQNVRDADNEQYDISGLTEDYMDGEYYGEEYDEEEYEA